MPTAIYVYDKRTGLAVDKVDVDSAHNASQIERGMMINMNRRDYATMHIDRNSIDDMPNIGDKIGPIWPREDQP